ncbi:MAG: 2-isopropylmalate synthase, partial [Pseudomonadota bacterium]
MTDQTTTTQERVKIFDTTLRDGEQSPGASMTLREKLEIATILDQMGVDIIEAGFPIASEGDFEAVSEIAKRAERSIICGLSRANFGDIDRCWAAVSHAKRPRIHTFIGTSPLHRQYQLNMEKEQVLEKIDATVRHARGHCEDVQWSPMDATRTERDYLAETVRVAIAAGATTINIPDTVGYTAPRESADIIAFLRREVPEIANCTISTHCHNDLGMATANSLAAVEAGARQIECTINGLGERAGNTALEEVVMALKVRGDIMPFATGIDTTRIMAASRMVAAVSGFPVQYNKAIVGKNAFAHESGIHQDGVLKNAETFEIMKPEDVGLNATNLVMGKHSGRHAFRTKLQELGVDLADNQLNDVFVRFKALADRKKEIYDDDILALVSETQAGDAAERIKLKFLRVICGTEAPQSADIILEIDGKEHRYTAKGDGPVEPRLMRDQGFDRREGRIDRAIAL